MKTMTQIKREIELSKTELLRNREHIKTMEQEWRAEYVTYNAVPRYGSEIYNQLYKYRYSNRQLKIKIRVLHMLEAFYSGKKFLDVERYYYDPVPFAAMKDNTYYSRWIERRGDQLVAIVAAKRQIQDEQDASDFDRWVQEASYSSNTKQYKLNFPRRLG